VAVSSVLFHVWMTRPFLLWLATQAQRRNLAPQLTIGYTQPIIIMVEEWPSCTPVTFSQTSSRNMV